MSTSYYLVQTEPSIQSPTSANWRRLIMIENEQASAEHRLFMLIEQASEDHQ